MREPSVPGLLSRPAAARRPRPPWVPSAPILLVALAVGADALGSRFPKRLEVVPGVVLLLIALVGTLRTAGPQSRHYHSDVRNINEVQRQIGEWLASHAAPDVWIAATDAGAVRYFSDLKTIDVMGLNTPEMLDHDEESRERKHSVDSSIFHVEHDGKLLNFVDTPGMPDYVGPALASLAAADTALVVVSAAGGIGVNTRRMFNAARNYGLARMIVISRIDAENVPFDPRVHEVVSVVETDEVPPGTVQAVLRPGYGGSDNTLRPAAVVVSRAVTPDRG